MRFPDVLGRAFLAGMRDGHEAFAACPVEHTLELARWVAHFGTVQPNGNECVAKRQGLVQRLVGFVFAQVTKEAQDQAAADAQLVTAILECLVDAIEHHFERDAAVGVCLWIEEGLGVNHILRFATLKVSPCEVIEVLFGAQNVGTLVVQVEKLLQVVEGVRTAQRLDISPRQGNLVALGQGEQQLGFQGAFKVQVQFGLGQGVQPVIHIR